MSDSNQQDSIESVEVEESENSEAQEKSYVA
jgi:hypothetical protein